MVTGHFPLFSDQGTTMLKAKIAEWNETYTKMSREVALDDLSPEAYEAEISYAILGVCGEDVDLALAVFNHPENEGGWMYGDVPAFLERKRVSST
jgi:hypothetical protein